MVDGRQCADEMSKQWKMEKVLIWGDETTHVQAFTCRVIHKDGGGWRMWYSRRNDDAKRYTFGYRDFTEDFNSLGETMMRIADEPSADGLNIIGVPSEWMLTQPVHLDLPDGRQRSACRRRKPLSCGGQRRRRQFLRGGLAAACAVPSRRPCRAA